MLAESTNFLSLHCSFDSYRSTKGASKQRRDLINAEIANLRDLLPLPNSTRQRLSQLQLMALVCVYIRKANYFLQVFGRQNGDSESLYEFSKALSGFLLMINRQGKLLYMSDNATEYLGHSMEDLLTQGDNVYDIIDKQDHLHVQEELTRPHYSCGIPSEEIVFVCRMNVSRTVRRQGRFGDQKIVLVRGHYMASSHGWQQPVFLGECKPLITIDTRETIAAGSTQVFTSLHSMDMKYIRIDTSGEFHLGYSNDQLRSTSWYNLVHWDDLTDIRSKHKLILSSEHERSSMLLTRLQTSSGEWQWVHIIMQTKDEVVNNVLTSVIVCTNQVLSQREADVLRASGWLYESFSAQSKQSYGMQHSSQEHLIHPQLPIQVSEPVHLSSTHMILPICLPQFPICPPQEPTQSIPREETLSRLKRKCNISLTHCQTKIPRINSDSYGRGVTSSVSSLTALPVFVEEMSSKYERSSCMYGSTQVLASTHSNMNSFGAIYKTKHKTDLLSHQPLTPESPLCCKIQKPLEILKIETHIVPDILTPEPSPVSSPQTSSMFLDDVLIKHSKHKPEQCVPDMRQAWKRHLQIANGELPVLDLGSIECYFKFVEDFTLEYRLKSLLHKRVSWSDDSCMSASSPESSHVPCSPSSTTTLPSSPNSMGSPLSSHEHFSMSSDSLTWQDPEYCLKSSNNTSSSDQLSLDYSTDLVSDYHSTSPLSGCALKLFNATPLKKSPTNNNETVDLSESEAFTPESVKTESSLDEWFEELDILLQEDVPSLTPSYGVQSSELYQLEPKVNANFQGKPDTP